MKIKQLSETTINRIAAGEVVERPSSVIKELVENSIDANATDIKININNGGRNLIMITDDGDGISKEDLPLAILSHTTSKLDESDISDINFFGFRGEALPSIASVSRMEINSIHNDSENNHGWSLKVNGGKSEEIIPSNITKGTKVIVRDIFFSTPARLKFLKSERSETLNIIDVVKKIALANPNISFTLQGDNNKTLLECIKHNNNDKNFYKSRIQELYIKDFIENSIEINFNNDSLKIHGFISIPTYNRGTSSELQLFVNNRPVKDKLLLASVRIAYQDYLAPGKYPIVIMFINLDNVDVDVNVHPTKAEVRFRDPTSVRNILVSTIKQSLQNIYTKSATSIAEKTLKSFVVPQNITKIDNNKNYVKPYSKTYNNYTQHRDFSDTSTSKNVLSDINNKLFEPIPHSKHINEKHEPHEHHQERQIKSENYPLGSAKSQLHETFIISQTEDSIIITDQHAAHERLVYEKLKSSYHNKNIATQRVLVPVIIELEPSQLDIINRHKDELQNFGLYFEKFGNNAISVTEIPVIIDQENIEQLVKSIIDDFIEYGADLTLEKKQNEVLSTLACHHSLRKGRVLNIHEMNNLLREMESTQNSNQCNHGRPTFIELKIKDINKLFGR